MATVLNTVQDFVAATRDFLQDNVVEYQYTDNDILLALNNGLQEAARVKQVLFAGSSYVVPSYTVVDGTSVKFSPRHKQALFNYVTGWLQLSHGDGDNDSRGAALVKLFREQILGTA